MLAMALAVAFAALFAVPASAVVNINTATKDELVALPGIGPAKAQAILDYRKLNGPFKAVDDLKSVKGIGAKRLRQAACRAHGRRPPLAGRRSPRQRRPMQGGRGPRRGRRRPSPRAKCAATGPHARRRSSRRHVARAARWRARRTARDDGPRRYNAHRCTPRSNRPSATRRSSACNACPGTRPTSCSPSSKATIPRAR